MTTISTDPAAVETTQDGGLVIHHLRVSPTQDLKDWVEFERAQQVLGGRTWEDAVRDAIRLGALMIVRARAAAALDFVKHQAAQVSADVRQCFEKFETSVYGLFVDPKDNEALGPVAHQFKVRVAALLEPVEAAIENAVEKIAIHVDPSKVDGEGKKQGLAAFKDGVDDARQAVADALKRLNPETSPTLKRWLDDLDPDIKDGKASKILSEMQSLADGVRNTSARLFGSVDPATNKQMPGQVEEVLKRYLNLDPTDPAAPLTQVLESIRAEIKTQFAALTAAQAKSGRMPDHGAQVPKDGFSHEDEVLHILKRFVGQQGQVEEVGETPGSIEGKKYGDFVVILDDGHTRICIEAKTGSQRKGEVSEYLKNCALNRRCQFTIFAAKDSETLETWFHNNSTWIWRPDAGFIATTRENLTIALCAAKISLAAIQKVDECAIDPAALQAEAQNLVSAMEALKSISRTAGTIISSARTNAGKIQREARRMAEQVIQSINRMRSMVGLEPDGSLTTNLPQVEDDAA